jgi:transposase
MQHRVRDQLLRQRTQLINALRSHMAELGIVAAQGREGLKHLLSIVAAEDDGTLPADAKASLTVLAAQLQACQTLIGVVEKRIVAQHKSSDASRRLETIPGIGVIGATTIAAIVTDPKGFRSGRDFAAWIGLVPRQDSTGGKQRLGHISKQGDRYLRRILVVGAHAVLRRARLHPEKYPWLTALLARRPFKVVAVALAKSRRRKNFGRYLGLKRRAQCVAEMTAHVESPEGLSPPGAPRTVHDPLESHGSRCSAVAMT